MCKFCDKIYPERNYPDDGPESFITACDDGTYDIYCLTGDPYELGIIPGIKICPYCGRDLAGSE